MKPTTLNDILSDFEPVKKTNAEKKPLALWVSADVHARFVKIQKLSRRGFGKKLCVALEAMLDIVEAKSA